LLGAVLGATYRLVPALAGFGFKGFIQCVLQFLAKSSGQLAELPQYLAHLPGSLG